MERNYSDFLQDILDAIAEVESFTAGVDFQSFQANREKSLAVVKLLEIIWLIIHFSSKNRGLNNLRKLG
jgi:uncharacterized protein with HEPN domain